MVRLLDDAERLKSAVPPVGGGCVETVPQLAINQLKSNAITRPGPDRPRRRPSFRPDLMKPLPNTWRRVILFIFDPDAWEVVFR